MNSWRYFWNRFHQTTEQLFFVGVESVGVVVFSLGFVSLMLILEFSFHMKMVLRQDTLVPAFSTLLMVRELGPVVTALLLSSRVGAAFAAEIGVMKNTDQLDALELLGLNVFGFVVLPRCLASVVACVCLTVIAVATACVGGAWIAAAKLGYGSGEFFNTMFAFMRPIDAASSLVKAAVFGAMFSLISCFYGLRCKPGSQGIGGAATLAVVTSSVWIILADFVVTYLFYAL